MNNITYPCNTAAVYQDVIFPISLNTKHDIRSEIDLAVKWFKRWSGDNEVDITVDMLVSFGGLYLSYQQSLRKEI